MQNIKGKTYIGIVTSNKMDKTITVSVNILKKHPLYNKQIKKNTKILAHDEKSEANIGDKVQIIETRPLSKRKNFRLQSIIEKSNN